MRIIHMQELQTQCMQAVYIILCQVTCIENTVRPHALPTRISVLDKIADKSRELDNAWEQ